MKFLADAVVIVEDKATGEPALVIIIEPQGRDDPTKEFSWPVTSPSPAGISAASARSCW